VAGKARAVTRKTAKDAEAHEAMHLQIGLRGDRRLTEKVILEVQAAARRVGLEVATIEVIRKPASGRKARKRSSGRKLRARA
jgi:hypothetical protein